MCNAVAEMVSSVEFRKSATKPWGVIMFKVTRNRLLEGETPIAPCDVCSGAGVVARDARGVSIRDDAGAPEACPRCGKTDRVVPVVHADEPDAETCDRTGRGEIVVSPAADSRSHYCGRCDQRFRSRDAVPDPSSPETSDAP